MNAQKITQTFNGLKQWQISGNYFKLLSAQYAVNVELFYLGQKVLYADDMEAGFYQSVLFDRVEITTPVSEEISFLIAPNNGGSDRLAGEVSVVSGELARVKAAQCFWGMASKDAVAGQYSYATLWNPVASGKNVFLNSIGFSLAAALKIDVAIMAAVEGAITHSVYNKKLGQSDCAAVFYTGAAAAMIAGVGQMAYYNLSASGTIAVKQSEPLMLSPGYGLRFSGQMNQLVQVEVQTFQEDAV